MLQPVKLTPTSSLGKNRYFVTLALVACFPVLGTGTGGTFTRARRAWQLLRLFSRARQALIACFAALGTGCMFFPCLATGTTCFTCIGVHWVIFMVCLLGQR